MSIFEFKGKSFYMNGKPYTVLSGAMHYWRIVPEYWEDRLRKLKACGFNTVETYVAWNLHERKINTPVMATDIAPTISQILKITKPNACVGKIIPFLFE